MSQDSEGRLGAKVGIRRMQSRVSLSGLIAERLDQAIRFDIARKILFAARDHS